MQNPISQINLWCQKNGKELPTYSFDGHGTHWSCLISAPWLETKNMWSQVFSSKKEAKYNIAEKALSQLDRINRFVINLYQQSVTLLIDGDQRMDCWRWLADQNVIWDKSLSVIVYISPTSPVVEHPPTRNIQIRKAKTTNRDSADAQILMDLGGFLFTSSGTTKYVIVSSDHILVQAAEDTPGVDWVPNQKALLEYFSKN